MKRPDERGAYLYLEAIDSPGHKYSLFDERRRDSCVTEDTRRPCVFRSHPNTFPLSITTTREKRK